jgi:protein subunit release factor B
MSTSKEKQEELQQRMKRLEIKEEDLIEKFILGSGKGGQKVNKTSSCVYLKHIPTGIEIKCQKERSRELNRFFARRELCERIETEILQQKTKKQQEAEKIRRQKKRRSRKQQQKMLEEKKQRGDLKKLRKSPRSQQE